jgi:hypothetical protein
MALIGGARTQSPEWGALEARSRALPMADDALSSCIVIVTRLKVHSLKIASKTNKYFPRKMYRYLIESC